MLVVLFVFITWGTFLLGLYVTFYIARFVCTHWNSLYTQHVAPPRCDTRSCLCTAIISASRSTEGPMTVEECARNKNLNGLVEFLRELAMFTTDAAVPLSWMLFSPHNTACPLFGGHAVHVGYEVLTAVVVFWNITPLFRRRCSGSNKPSKIPAWKQMSN
jgi:hypothetical protein